MACSHTRMRDVNNVSMNQIWQVGAGALPFSDSNPGRFAEQSSSKTVTELHGRRAGRRSELTVPFPEARAVGWNSDLDMTSWLWIFANRLKLFEHVNVIWQCYEYWSRSWRYVNISFNLEIGNGNKVEVLNDLRVGSWDRTIFDVMKSWMSELNIGVWSHEHMLQNVMMLLSEKHTPTSHIFTLRKHVSESRVSGWSIQFFWKSRSRKSRVGDTNS